MTARSAILAAIAAGAILLGGAASADPAAAADPAFGEGPIDFSTDDFGFQKNAVAAGDLSGDGRPDLTMAGFGGIGALRLTGGSGNGPENLRIIGPDPNTDLFFDDEIGEFRDVGIAELSGDARLDIIAVGAGGARRFVQTASGEFQPDGARLTQADLDALAIGRIDGDALDDVVVVGPTGGWLIRRQGGGFASPQAFLGGTNLNDVVLGNFGGDGRTDIAVAGTTGARVLLQTGTSSFTTTATSPIVTGSLESIAAGGFDSGATLDLAVSRPGSNSVLVRLGRGDAPGTFDAAADVAVGENPGALAAADLDLNGTTDLVVARREVEDDDTTEIRDRATVLGGAGSGAFTFGATIQVHEAGQEDQINDVRSIAVADVDVDDRPDLLFADSALSAAIMARNTSIIVPPPGPPGPGGGGGGGTSAGGRAGGGSAGPGLTVSFARRQALSLKAGIVARATCATACTVKASGRISLGARARKIALGKVVRSLRSGQSTRIALPVPRPRWPAIGRALRRGSRVLATVVITATDARGTRATRTIVFRLVPRRPGRG